MVAGARAVYRLLFVTNEAFSKTGWVGFEGVSALTVDLDLGESIENVAELDVGFLRVAEYGIELPERVVFSVSDDGGTYVAVVMDHRK